MLVLEDQKERKNPKRTGTSNPTQNFVAKVCTRLYVTIQYSNLCIQASVCDYVAQKPAFRRNFFQKRKNYKGI